MKPVVKDIMTPHPKTCSIYSNLTEVALSMWDNDCGILPVVNAEQQVVGAITDRDIAMAAATKGRPLTHITVGEVMPQQLYLCQQNDDLKSALRIMKAYQIRRLPVTDHEGAIVGMLSLNDVILAKGSTGRKGNAVGLTDKDIVETLQGICTHRATLRAA